MKKNFEELMLSGSDPFVNIREIRGSEISGVYEISGRPARSSLPFRKSSFPSVQIQIFKQEVTEGDHRRDVPAGHELCMGLGLGLGLRGWGFAAGALLFNAEAQLVLRSLKGEVGRSQRDAELRFCG